MKWWSILAIVSAAAAVPAFDYSVRAPGGPLDLQKRVEAHWAIVHRTALEPDRFRILTPWLMEPPVRLLNTRMPYADAVRRAYDLFYYGVLVALLFSLQRYFRIWFSDEQALIGSLLIAATLPVTLRHHIFAPYSFVEPILLTLVLGALARRSLTLPGLLMLTAIATLNRETGMLLPIAAFVMLWPDDRQRAAVWGGTSLLAAVLIYAGVRLAIGPADRLITVGGVWRLNLGREAFLAALTNIPLFLGVTGWGLLVVGTRRAPEYLRRTLWIAVPYVALLSVYAIWYEVRLLMTLYPILVTLVLVGIFEPAASTDTLPPDSVEHS
jgi:hypothetical protein